MKICLSLHAPYTIGKENKINQNKSNKKCKTKELLLQQPSC